MLIVKNILKVGNSLGVLLPKDFVKEHNLKSGDKIAITQQNGVITYSLNFETKSQNKITAEFDKWLNSVMSEDKEILDELA